MSRMTENLNLQRGLLKYLAQIPEVQLLDNVRVTDIEKEDGGNGWSLVRLSNGRTFRTRLLVGLVISDDPRLGSNLVLGWRRWAEFSCSCIRGNHNPWVGLQYPRCRCYTLTCSARTVPTSEYHRISTLPAHWADRLPSPLSNRIIDSLVNHASFGCCVKICGSYCTCELCERCFSHARSFDPLPTRALTLVGCFTEVSHSR